MKTNMGRLDRTLRLIAALAFLVLAIAGVVKGTLAVILIVLAAVFVLTTLIGFCPLYKPLGVSTKPEDKAGTPRIDV
ncbi:MAG TPA: DUF2892 domain-containing protein [Acidobacteriota bacterium]|nr:DUF2892 domain-containing protein [Acidobacteriota bacterium]